jgi:hypothetical protein
VSLKLLEPLGPVQACNGIALTCFIFIGSHVVSVGFSPLEIFAVYIVKKIMYIQFNINPYPANVENMVSS